MTEQTEALEKYKDILNLFERELLITVEQTKWYATHPQNRRETIVNYNDDFYKITERRSWRTGAYFEYSKPEIVQVKRKYRTTKVVKISWVEVE